ncbi:hypothetical protein [Sporosarcina sp. SAFN-010]|uniref:hypothetical protein n=1 Tax=Sporosarcina sp. SAFN-010 TaxID=3387273 RepID=UPI003F8137DE
MAETKSFRETLKENNAKFKEGMQADKEKRAAQHAENKKQWNQSKAKVKEDLQSIKAPDFTGVKDEFKTKFAESKNEFKEQHEENKAKFAEKKASPKTDAPVKRFRASDVLVMGLSLWLAIPLLVVIFIVGLLAVVGAWDWIVGLFN